MSLQEQIRRATLEEIERQNGGKVPQGVYNTIMGTATDEDLEEAAEYSAEIVQNNARRGGREVKADPVTPPVADTPTVTNNTPTVTEPSDAYKKYLSYTDKYNELTQGYLNGTTDAAKYTGLAKNYIDQYLNRGDFSYDINTDEMYAMYRDQYLKQAQQAQQDVTAQAAGLTGGYGSSYASAVGQNAYNSVMDRLDTKALELYENAYNRYQQEGQNLLNMASLSQAQADTINQKTLSDAQLYQALGQQAYQESSEYKSAVDEENSKAAWDSLSEKLADNAKISGKYKMQGGKTGKKTGVLGIANAIDLERDLNKKASKMTKEDYVDELYVRLSKVSIGGKSMSDDEMVAYVDWVLKNYNLEFAK